MVIITYMKSIDQVLANNKYGMEHVFTKYDLRTEHLWLQYMFHIYKLYVQYS